MITRRNALVAATLAPQLLHAQTPRTRKLGYLHGATISPDSFAMSIFGPAWRRLGYRDGETVLLRSGEGRSERMVAATQELIGLGAEAIIAVGPQAVRAAMGVTRTVPIIGVDLESDPVRSGFVQSFARPGGNLTGLFMDFPGLSGKWLQILREAAPGLVRVAIVWDPTTGLDQLDAARGAVAGTGLELLVIEVRSAAEQEAALRRLDNDRPTGVVQLGSPLLVNNAGSFVAPLIALKLPSISYFKPIAVAGGLMSYGPLLEAYFPRAVVLADRILAGARPAELSIEKPERFEFVVNQRTAQAIGLTLPPALIAIADEVLE